MTDEVRRISKLVAEGKLSPEDAAELIDAFYKSDRREAYEGSEPPPAPNNSKDPFRGLMDSFEKLIKEGNEAVNWTEVKAQATAGAKKGFEAIKVGLEDLGKGKVNLGWLTTQETKEVSLPLSVPSGKTLRIENPCGSVKVVGGFDVGTATAHARFKGATLDEAKAKAAEYTLIVEESDHLVLIRQPDVSGLVVDLEIQLAGSATIEARTDNGNIELLDTKGGARVSAKSGQIKLRGLVGPVEASSDSGDVWIEDAAAPAVTIESKSGLVDMKRVRSNINARTASGSISVEDSSGKVLSLESVSGNVQVNLNDAVTGSLNVRTVNGDSLVQIPDGSDCRVSLSTLRGNVASRIELTEEARADMRITGRLGSGSGTLDVSSVTGNITLELRDQIAE